MKLQEREMVISLDIDQMLLRGSSLRNTDFIYGISIYTGHDTKVMMNSSKSKPKFSKIEIAMNRYILISILIQVLVCTFSALYTVIWRQYNNHIVDFDYLELNIPLKYGFG
jgi:magnesium-transporting ATPase (P-type)